MIPYRSAEHTARGYRSGNQRHTKRGSQGHPAAYQDPRNPRTTGIGRTPSFCRRGLPMPHYRGRGNRSGHRLPGTDPIRNRRPGSAQPLRRRQLRIRTQQGRTSRPHGLRPMWPSRRISGRNHRNAAERDRHPPQLHIDRSFTMPLRHLRRLPNQYIQTSALT